MTNTLQHYDPMSKKLSRVAVTGDIPSPRIGHSCTPINDKLMVLFGGLGVDDRGGSYLLNDLYCFNKEKFLWKKISLQTSGFFSLSLSLFVVLFLL